MTIEPTAAPGDAGTVDVAPCWSCAGPVAGRALFCHACGAIQPPGRSDYFARLVLPRRFDHAVDAIERQYLGFARQLHPDRFARRTPRERAIAQSQSVELNAAYETLKNPLRRARYLAGLVGVDLPVDGKTIADPELLTEAMEAREALGEAASTGEVDALVATSSTNMAAIFEALPALFDARDRDTLRSAILRLSYLDKFADEARARRLNLVSAP